MARHSAHEASGALRSGPELTKGGDLLPVPWRELDSVSEREAVTWDTTLLSRSPERYDIRSMCLRALFWRLVSLYSRTNA